MTSKDKLLLLRFLVRPGMYIPIQDESNYISFIHGFELGKEKYADTFSRILSEYLTSKYRIRYDSLGGNGQISKLAKKKKTDWVLAFRKASIELLLIQNADNECKNIFKEWVSSLLTKIEANNPWFFSEPWVREWKICCQVEEKWFQAIWTAPELKFIKQLNKEIKKKCVLADADASKAKLIALRNKFEKVKLESE